ncbi:MAG: nucleotide exchange factor GrpE [Pseudomonadota bacterium]|jgi:molecular chaperone GrpE
MSDEQKMQDEVEVGVEQSPSADDQTLALAQAQDEIASLKDQMLRTQAEMQNVRRRADADVEKAHKFGVEKFANEMISVVDNLERAIAACDAQDAATKVLRDGVEMTLSSMLSSLAKFKVEVVNPLNESFNPELHQAITLIDSPDAAPNSVIAVMQKGYTLQGRLLRPAMVVVSKGSPVVNTKA